MQNHTKTKNIAILGASYLQLPLIEKAKEMGLVTHVFAWQVNDVGEKAADFFHPISVIEKEEILKVCRKIGICGICSIASDVAVITVNYVSEKLGLCGNPVRTTYACTNKHQMRRAFENGGDPSPYSIVIKSADEVLTRTFDFPVIVKPTDRSGSRGVCKVDNTKDLVNAINNAITISCEKKALIEEYVYGQEYSVEYISYRGKHHFLALTLKYTTGAPNFIETGHMQPAPVDDETLRRIENTIEHALNTLGIVSGASHSEIKIGNAGEIKIIEIGARMGGDCIGSDLVLCSTGYDFVKMVIQVACDEEPTFERVCEPMAVQVKYILDDNDVRELERDKIAGKVIRIIELQLENIGNVTDSSNRAGCYIRKL